MPPPVAVTLREREDPAVTVVAAGCAVMTCAGSADTVTTAAELVTEPPLLETVTVYDPALAVAAAATEKVELVAPEIAAAPSDH